jgi:hypothetical protein
MIDGGSLLNIRSSSRRFMSSGRKKWPTDRKTASRVEGVMDPSGVVAPGSYNALWVSFVHGGQEATEAYSEPRLEVRQMIVFLKLT